MTLTPVPDACEDCEALGAELCAPCGQIVLQLHAQADREDARAALPLPDTDLTLRQASVVLAHVRRYAPDAYADALGYAREYLGRRG